MRTLKKTLCLVLCLAMMVGLCAMGASAVTIDDYKDKDKIQYEEAVTLLSALGVLEGYPDKTFKPEGELNRAEGAAIMTRLLTKHTPTGTSSFTDMGDYGWAQPYVKFCEDYGIINGYGDGRFGPGDKLTTTQFAKMLICALGYDAEKEGFVDTPAWAINVTKKVTGLNLADGLAAYNPNANVTRETAAQLAFNTLFQTMVYADGNSYMINMFGFSTGYVTVKDGAPVPNTSYDYDPEYPDTVMQFIEASFPEIKVHRDEDDFGIPTNYWFKGKNAQDKAFAASKVIAESIAVPVLAVYDTGIGLVSEKTVYDDACFNTASKIEVFENGAQLADVTVSSKNSTSKYPGYLAGRPWGIGDYKGAQAILLDTSEYSGAKQDVRLIVKYPYLAQVVGVKPGEDRTVALRIYVAPTKAVIANYPTEEFKKGDFVLVYALGSIADTQAYTAADFEEQIVCVELADSLNGTLSRVDLVENEAGTGKALTVAGAKKSIGSKWLANLGPVDGKGVAADKIDYAVGYGTTLYMNYGFVLGMVSDAANYGDYVVVVSEGSYTTDGFGNTTAPVGYVKQDGTALEAKVIVPVGEPDYFPYWTTVDVGSYTSTFAKYYAEDYMEDVNDEGTLFTNAKTGEYELRHDQPELAMGSTYKIIADSKTNFILKTVTGFKAYTGIANVPDYVGTTPVDVYALVPGKGTEDAHAVAVYIDVTTMTPVSAPADPVYALGLYPSAKTLDDSTVVYVYTVIKDGELTELMSKAPIAALSKRGLVIPVYQGKYVKEVVDIAANPAYLVLNAKPEECKFTNDTVKIIDTTYAVSKDAVAYVYNYDTGVLTTTTVEALNYLPKGEVTAIATAVDKTILKMYYVYPIS